jgi:hypothetical protein
LVVEVPAQDRAAKETSALIEACTTGLRGGRCELTQNRDLESGSAVAIISWRGEQRLGALVEVGQQREQGAVWRSQELDFKPEDQRVERFRALGFAIAALFRGTTPEAGKSASPATKGLPPSQAQAQAAIEPKPGARQEQLGLGAGDPQSPADAAARAFVPSRSARLWISAGPSAQYGPELRAWRYGGQLQVAAGPPRFPGFLSVSAGYAQGGDLAGVSLGWSALGLGLGLRTPLTPNFELRGAARGLLVNVSGRASEGTRTSQQSVWMPGVGLVLELELHGSGALGLALAGEAQRSAGDVPIQKHDRPVANVGKTALGAALTLEVRLFQESSTQR